MNQSRMGIIFVALSAVLYSLGGICMKLIPWSGMALNGARCIIALAVYCVYLLLTHHAPRINRWILLGASAIALTNLLFSIANKLTTAANAIVLQFTSPVFVILLSALLLHRRPKKLDLSACAIMMLGILCFFLESLGGGKLTGDVLALLTGLTYSVVFLLNEMPDGDPISSVFWAAPIGILIAIPSMVTQFKTVPLDSTAVVSIVVLGAFQMGIAFICLTIGLKTTPPLTASLISALEPILSPIWVALFWGEKMGLLSLIGAVIVIGTVIVYNILKDRQARRIQTSP